VDAATSWARIEESEFEVAGVTSGTGFGRSVGLRIRGKVYAVPLSSSLILVPDGSFVGE
jgi:hypothetical protein